MHDGHVFGTRQHRFQVCGILCGVDRLPIDREMLMRIHPDPPIELEIRNLELPVALGDENVEPLDELHDFLPIKIARELIELALIRLSVPAGFALVVAAFETPNIGPVGG